MKSLHFQLKKKKYFINLKTKFVFGIFLFDVILYKWKVLKFLNADLRFFFILQHLEFLFISERLKQSGFIKCINN